MRLFHFGWRRNDKYKLLLTSKALYNFTFTGLTIWHDSAISKTRPSWIRKCERRLREPLPVA